MKVDPQSHIPVYLQIVEAIRHSIVRGVHRPGEALPSVRELSVKLGVNPNTVKRAFEALEREGLIESRRGLGMFVTSHGMKSAREKSANEVMAAIDEVAVQARAAGMKPQGVMRQFARAVVRAFSQELKT